MISTRTLRSWRLPVALAILALGWTPAALGAAVPRGVERVKIVDVAGVEVGLYAASYALVIGIADYTAGWPDLPGVRSDVEEVGRVLEEHGFEVRREADLDHQALDRVIRDFIAERGEAPDARLVIYFAGHGHTLKLSDGRDMGYVVPADAPRPNRDRRRFLARALPMDQVEVYAKQIQSKHALFLFDSCFSGSLFALERAVPQSISAKTAKPVRQFITSGSADETVPDESVFRRQLVAALGGEGDVNGDGYVTGAELGEFLYDRVANYSLGTQHPQYGKIRHPRLDKGDFVFRLPAPPPSPVAVPPVVAPPTVPGPPVADSGVCAAPELWPRIGIGAATLGLVALLYLFLVRPLERRYAARNRNPLAGRNVGYSLTILITALGFVALAYLLTGCLYPGFRARLVFVPVLWAVHVLYTLALLRRG